MEKLEHWSLQNVFHKKLAPSSYPAINFTTAYATARGVSLSRAQPDAESAWIGGSEFSILVGTTQPELSAKIELELLLPDFLEANRQSFTVSINRETIEGTYYLEKGKSFELMEIQIPDGYLVQGNNLFTLKFSETGSLENRKNWQAAGKLKSFSLVQN